MLCGRNWIRLSIISWFANMLYVVYSGGREREFYLTPNRPGCGHKVADTVESFYIINLYRYHTVGLIRCGPRWTPSKPLPPPPSPFTPWKQFRFWCPLRKHFYALRRAQNLLLSQKSSVLCTKQLNPFSCTWAAKRVRSRTPPTAPMYLLLCDQIFHDSLQSGHALILPQWASQVLLFLITFPALIWLWLVPALTHSRFVMPATCLLFSIHFSTRGPAFFVQISVRKQVCRSREHITKQSDSKWGNHPSLAIIYSFGIRTGRELPNSWRQSKIGVSFDPRIM